MHHTYSFIDVFLVDKFMLQKIVKSDIHVISWSDHAPVSISVGVGKTPKEEQIDGGMTYLLCLNLKTPKLLEMR